MKTKQNKPYFQMEVADNVADLMIYGDITSWPWSDSDVSAYNLSQKLANLDPNVTQINVWINSYGGEVAEALAIYNALSRHPATVVTHCDGFACSAASVIYMAGSKRVMAPSSLLMIHNAWTDTRGNADQLRKAADDLDTISSASVQAYVNGCDGKISEADIRKMMDEETWITPQQALEYGFCTVIGEEDTQTAPAQSARSAIFQKLTGPSMTPGQKMFSAFMNK